MAHWFTYLSSYLVPQQIQDDWMNGNTVVRRWGKGRVSPWDHRALSPLFVEEASTVPMCVNCYQEPASPDNLVSPTSQSHFQKQTGFFLLPALVESELPGLPRGDAPWRTSHSAERWNVSSASRSNPFQTLCNAGKTGANNWASCQQATGIAFDILIVSWSMSHVGSITVIAGCTSVNLLGSLLMSVWVCEKPDITRDLNWAWLLPFPFSCHRTRELTNADNC